MRGDASKGLLVPLRLRFQLKRYSKTTNLDTLFFKLKTMNKQFEEWLLKQEYQVDNEDWYEANAVLDLSYPELFKQLPLSMQWGVYLEFFDSLNIQVLNRDTTWYVYDFRIDRGEYDHENVGSSPTRQEALQEAIKKAFSLLESK